MGKMKTVCTGQGLFNYEHLIKIVKDKKPNIDILLENSIPNKVKESIDFLNKI